MSALAAGLITVSRRQAAAASSARMLCLRSYKKANSECAEAAHHRTRADVVQRSGVVVVDNMSNSKVEVLHRVRMLAATHHKSKSLAQRRHPPLYFHACDIRDRAGLDAVVALYAQTPTTSRIIAAIHFAALKSVAESLVEPMSYYQVNVGGTLNLIEVLGRWSAKKLVFSSSCVVYGSECDGEGITEDMCDVTAGASKGITNPCESVQSAARTVP